MALPAFSRSRPSSSSPAPSRTELLRTIEVWESNHRLLITRLSDVSRQSRLCGCYLRWALLEIEARYNESRCPPSEEVKTTLEAAWEAAGGRRCIDGRGSNTPAFCDAP